uniref:Uncharacterized protein n=1 Tax=Fagus sylvatica TaxID=28930 RepID=A0A2N9H0Q7_FAGSY
MADLREILPFSCSSSSSLLKSILPSFKKLFLARKSAWVLRILHELSFAGTKLNAKKSRSQRQRQEGRDRESEGEIVRRLCDWIGGRGRAVARVLG